MLSNTCYIYSWDISPTKYHPDLKIYTSDTKSVISAHRAVLASHSYMLKTAFLSSDVEGEAVLILPDFCKEQVDQMLQFLYGQIGDITCPGEIFPVLGLSPDDQESEYFVDQDESEHVFETRESEIKGDEEATVKKPRSKPKFFTNMILKDPLVDAGDESESAVDVDDYIVSDPSNIKPWLCQICLFAGASNPYRAMHRHNLKYHIMKKHLKMIIPKRWQVISHQV